MKKLTFLMLVFALIAVNGQTPCTLTSYPWTEGFEGVTGTAWNAAGNIPNCWYTYAQSGVANHTPHVTLTCIIHSISKNNFFCMS